MTKYRVRNPWWEGVIEAESISMSHARTRLDLWGSETGPMGAARVGIITPTLVAVQENKLLEDVVLDGRMHENRRT